MILFGPAGIPHSRKSRGTEAGVREVARLGLDCMEVEFVHGVRMSEQAAAKIGKVAREHNVALTAHGPYYVNLASLDPEKEEASRRRVLDTALRAARFGGRGITFHAAFYQKRDPGLVFDIVRGHLESIVSELAGMGISIPIEPELTGKPSQFGSLEELIELSRQVKGVRPCIDFSHYVARNNGRHNDYKGFRRAINKIRRGLGVKAIRELHMHVSGIEWTGKGERKHRRLDDSDFNWRELLRALLDTGVSGIMICESPAMEDDAILLKREYLRLRDLAGND